jgi:hypothetical protein
MIKPGTLCMIRGVPSNRLGSEFNGNVVTVTGRKQGSQELIYHIEPTLYDRHGRHFTGCRHQWLYPFEDFDPETLHTTTKTLEAA